MKSIYLVNPKIDFPTYFGSEVLKDLNLDTNVFISDIVTPTIAAFVPKDFEVQICDEHVTPIDFDTKAECVGITGRNAQYQRMKEIAKEFRSRGKTVIIGGPFASLSPKAMRPHCDILVRGEIEEIADELFSDLLHDRWKDEYVGTHPNPIISPIPRWDLYPNHTATTGMIQFSRGCPYSCDFCDLELYAGRGQRHKLIKDILNELDVLYKYGYRHLFIADDNLTANHRYIKEVMQAIKEWNDKLPSGYMAFVAQLSLDAANDEELIRICAEAGLTQAYVGIETLKQTDLAKINKPQIMNIDVKEKILLFLKYGIAIMGGLIAGFDFDSFDVFQQQYEFTMTLPIPILLFQALVAYPNTRIFNMLQQQDRLIPDIYVRNIPWESNIIPKQMTREDLTKGIRWLLSCAYTPEAFYERVTAFLNVLGKNENLKKAEKDSRLEVLMLAVIKYLRSLGEREQELCRKIIQLLIQQPRTGYYLVPMLIHYVQIKHMYSRKDY